MTKCRCSDFRVDVPNHYALKSKKTHAPIHPELLAIKVNENTRYHQCCKLPGTEYNKTTCIQKRVNIAGLSLLERPCFNCCLHCFTLDGI